MRNDMILRLVVIAAIAGFFGSVSAFFVHHDTGIAINGDFVRRPFGGTDIKPVQEIQEPETQRVEIVATDAHQERMLEELQSVHEWADGHRIFISETGVPRNDDSEKYKSLMAKFYETTDLLAFDVAVWAVGNRWGDYPIVPYNPATLEDNEISAPFNASLTTEEYFRGLNLAGPEFGLNPEAAGTLGEVGVDYTYYNDDEIWRRIKNKGFTHVRLPVRLERLFDATTGDFRESDRIELIGALETARREGVQVVIDPHNYGALQVNGRKQTLGDDVFTISLYNQMMTGIAQLVSSYTDTVSMIGLMNEPKNLTATDWEVFAQSALNNLRRSGWKGTIEVPTGKWQGAKDVANLHRRPWIDDPQENFVYGVHQYFDFQSTGFYHDSYESDEKKIGIKYKPRGVFFEIKQ